MEADAVELLTRPWHLVGNNGAAEAYQNIDPMVLRNRNMLRVTYNLHGLRALDGDASALVFDQSGWHYVMLSRYGQNGLDGEQVVRIPVSDFPGLKPDQPLGTLHTRFWYSRPFTVDITSIVAYRGPVPSAATSTPVPGSLTVCVPGGMRAGAGIQTEVPLQLLSDTTGRDVTAWAATLTYDPAVLRFVAARTDQTLSDGWSITTNDRTPGVVRLTAYGTRALSGSGALAQLAFEVIGNAGSRTTLSLSGVRFNEGNPPTSTQSGDLTVRALTISGSVAYQRTNRPVSGAVLDLQSSGTTLTATTSVNGSYLLELPRLGPASVGITKTADLRDSLSALDAAWISQYDAGLRSFTPEQQAACDVSGNGSCTSFDASILAAYLVGQSRSGSRAGEWQFAPPRRSYPQLDQDLSGEAYRGVVLGDVTTNWGVPASASTRRSRASRQTGAAALPVGASTELSLVLGTHTPDLLGYALTLSYDPTLVEVQEALKANTQSVGWTVLTNTASPGQIRVVAYGVTPLSGVGPLLKLRVAGKTAGASSSAVRVASARLNEQPEQLTPDPAVVRVELSRPMLYLPFVRR